MLNEIKECGEKYGAIAGLIFVYAIPFLIIWHFAQKIVSKGTQRPRENQYYLNSGTQAINNNLFGYGTNAGKLYGHLDIKLLKACGG
ncbi:MAG: hypothetical protein OIN87_10970 [Candidatus Methanoperedens sp.]|nr:hypothetical protein [Candidatus Methanoperedens sp.]